jgi:hypothetical protein
MHGARERLGCGFVCFLRGVESLLGLRLGQTSSLVPAGVSLSLSQSVRPQFVYCGAVVITSGFKLLPKLLYP